MPSLPDRLKAFNQGRDREPLAGNDAAMAKDPSAFLRGTCPLFDHDCPKGSPLDATPAGWELVRLLASL